MWRRWRAWWAGPRSWRPCSPWRRRCSTAPTARPTRAREEPTRPRRWRPRRSAPRSGVEGVGLRHAGAAPADGLGGGARRGGAGGRAVSPPCRTLGGDSGAHRGVAAAARPDSRRPRRRLPGPRPRRHHRLATCADHAAAGPRIPSALASSRPALGRLLPELRPGVRPSYRPIAPRTRGARGRCRARCRRAAAGGAGDVRDRLDRRRAAGDRERAGAERRAASPSGPSTWRRWGPAWRWGRGWRLDAWSGEPMPPGRCCWRR